MEIKKKKNILVETSLTAAKLICKLWHFAPTVKIIAVKSSQKLHAIK